MDILELDQKAEELRKIKSDARRNNRIIKANTNDDGHDLDTGAETRPSFETARRDLSIEQGTEFEAPTISGRFASDAQSTREVTRGIGRKRGRPKRDRSSSSEDTNGSVGRLESVGGVPLRIDQPDATFQDSKPDIGQILSQEPKISHRKLGEKLGVSHETARKLRAEWEEAHPKEPSFFKTGGGDTLSKEEAENLYEPFIQSLEDIFDATDKYLWQRQKVAGKETYNAPVWSDFDEQEAARLTKLLFKWGQKNQLVASGIRVATEAGDYIAVGTMFAPRFVKTVEIYRETRKPRASRKERTYATEG
jgi:hypothetical protein